MSLKDIIKADIKTVFFNDDEFAEDHNIDGRKVSVVVDNETLKKRNQKEYDGILQADILYFIKDEDVNRKPVVGQVQRFDGKIYSVFDVKYDSGVYEIILQIGRS